ncbi:carbonic anhydrase [Streptomyces sp. RS10V-4]|uniref:carbonic anhydrase n=1 Tax=Streptomyces rhizoryzae TaxID=2932493 RepID=UPI002005E6B8|nr:carbonic anhydrase [Streptomyces rhizoryzae]MCK7626043.1 carbonic anhydrase [Streptomyces rhizoryzae]
MDTVLDHARTLPHLPAGPRPIPGGAPAELPAARALFIACSDSRVVPTLLTGAEPGELHELRTAGHVVPRYRPDARCGIAATLELALGTLEVPDIILCGHTHCAALQDDPPAPDLPLAHAWFTGAAHHPGRGHTARRPGSGAPRTPEQRHLLAQLHHLRTYPCVTRRLATRRLRLHVWLYNDRTAETLGWDTTARTFRPL